MHCHLPRACPSEKNKGGFATRVFKTSYVHRLHSSVYTKVRTAQRKAGQPDDVAKRMASAEAGKARAEYLKKQLELKEE